MQQTAAEAASAALLGLQLCHESKVHVAEHEKIVQQLAAAREEQIFACQQLDKAQQSFLKLEEQSSETIRELREKVQNLNNKLYSCQYEVCCYERSVNKKMSEIAQHHRGFVGQISALKADVVQLRLKHDDAQHKLQEKDAEITRLLKAQAQQRSILFNILPTAAKPPRYQPPQLVQRVAELTQQVEELQQQLSEVQDELAEKDFELAAAMSGNAWGFKTASSSTATSSNSSVEVATQPDLDIYIDEEFETEEEEEVQQQQQQQQQVQVQVVLNLSVPSVEEESLKVLNCSLQRQLDECQTAACHHEQELRAAQSQAQQLQQQKEQVQQLMFNMDEKMVEMQQERDALKSQLAADASRYQQEMAAVKVDHHQLQEQVAVLQHLVAERDDEVVNLKQLPQVKVLLSIVDNSSSSSSSMTEDAQLQVVQLQEQVAALNHHKLHLEAELNVRDRDVMQHQQQLTAAMQVVKDLQATAAAANSRMSTGDATDADVGIAAPEHLSLVLVKHGGSSGSSSSSTSLLYIKRRFTGDSSSSSSSQPGTPGTPALSQCSSFAVRRNGSSSSSSSFAVGRGNSSSSSSRGDESCKVDGGSCLAVQHVGDTASEDDSTFGLISTDKPRQLPRHKALFKNIKRRLTGPFACLKMNSSGVME